MKKTLLTIGFGFCLCFIALAQSPTNIQASEDNKVKMVHRTQTIKLLTPENLVTPIIYNSLDAINLPIELNTEKQDASILPVGDTIKEEEQQPKKEDKKDNN